jgi:uncharacterized protein YjbI with pentapeptide repeats
MISAGCGSDGQGDGGEQTGDLADAWGDLLDPADLAEGRDTVAETMDSEDVGPEPPVPSRRSPAMAYHEHSLADLPEGILLNPDDTVILWLEHHEQGLHHPDDSGGRRGMDEVQVEYFHDHLHTFCWDAEEEVDDPHWMTLHDDAGNELGRVEEGSGCTSIFIKTGAVRKQFFHSGRNEEGDLLFLQPADSSVLSDRQAMIQKSGPVTTSSVPACQAVKQLTHGTIGQLAAGQFALTTTCSPVAATSVWVYDKECMNLTDTAGATWVDAAAAYAGPGTTAILYTSSRYSGRSVVVRQTGAASIGSTLTCLSEEFRNDSTSDQKRAFKVWYNDYGSMAGTCKVKWAGTAATLPAGGPKEGEAFVYGNYDYKTYGETDQSRLAYIFDGPCNDLCKINAHDWIDEIWAGENTVIILNKQINYGGESWPYQRQTNNLYDFSKNTKSLVVESMSTYNNEATLIRVNKCNGCYLVGLRLPDGENLTGAQLVGANLTNARMVGAEMAGVDATDAIFRGANLAYVNLKGATLTRAVFEGDDTTNPADLSYAYMPNARLDYAHLNNVTADYAHIYGGQATVSHATMVGTHLANAVLSNMDFSQTTLTGAILTGANLVSASFLGTDLTNADLVGTSLQGATFDGSTLYGARLQNAAISFEAGVITVTRLGDNNTLQTASVSFGPTSLPKTTTNIDTFCPYGGQSMDDNPWCDSVAEMTAHDPPAPPKCVPSATQYCPRTPK